MEEEKKKEYRTLRPWQGFLVILVAAVYLFLIAPKIVGQLGRMGSILGEAGFFILSVAAVWIWKGNLKEVFPFRKPSFTAIAGVVIMWMGMMLVLSVTTLILQLFFPAVYFESGVETALGYAGTPVVLLTLILAVSPAICEEVLFRGVFVNSLRPLKNKWAILLISGIIFGLFHGSLAKFLPTTLGGIALGFIFLETGNLFYSCLYHFINNMSSVVVIAALGDIYRYMAQSSYGLEMQEIPLACIGLSVILSAAAPACLYIGNYLLHSQTEGYRDTLFPRKKPGVVISLIAVSGILFVSGVYLFIYGMIEAGPMLYK